MAKETKSADERKTERVLFLWDRLGRGGSVSRAELTEMFNVNIRTASRYIAEIRKYLEKKEERDGIRRELYYDRTNGTYRIRDLENEMISSGELFAIGKILLASRAFHKKELESLLGRLLQSAVVGKGKKEVEDYIKSELFDYQNPKHRKPDIHTLWAIARAVHTHHVLSFGYKKQGSDESVPHKVCPEGVVFSEYYFYMLGVPEKEWQSHGDETRAYRVDRMFHLKETDTLFDVNYGSRLREGAYKNSVQYMYGGEEEWIQFIYTGPSVEAVLDRLPTAKQQQLEDGTFLITDKIRGDGILMWLLSQGSRVKVLSPERLRTKWRKEAAAILEESEPEK